MLDYAERALRLELVLCSKALRRMAYKYALCLSEDMPKMLLLTHVRSLEMSNNFVLNDDVLDALPTKLRLYYKGMVTVMTLDKICLLVLITVLENSKEYDINIGGA